MEKINKIENSLSGLWIKMYKDGKEKSDTFYIDIRQIMEKDGENIDVFFQKVNKHAKDYFLS